MATADQGNMLVAGATGVATQFLIDIVRATPGWRVTGLSRRRPSVLAEGVGHIAADLLDAAACKAALDGQEFTHVVYAARAPHALYSAMQPYERVGIELVAPNLAMLENVVAAAATPSLAHVHAVMGSKWYGFHIGPVTTPMLESDPGHLPPNYYFAQQRFLEAAAAQAGWTWSVSRPNVVSGSRGLSGPNFVSTIGAYAAICRHLGRPLDFPGKPGNFTSLQEISDANLLAKSIFWMCRSQEAENQAFNVTNGDTFRWSSLWPTIARFFGMEAGGVRHMSLIQWMGDKAELWDEIVAQHGLARRPLDQVASWAFADFIFGLDFDVFSSTTKIRKAGFHDIVDTTEMFLQQLRQLREKRILP